ncbi:MAG: ABC transporter ATP-binding protein [Defluviitaleaceae bacterium]|nr:ABC transporter ATP-binding protein [Defluviitaleaceae bacterium]
MVKILKFEEVSLTYQSSNGEIEALKNINFDVNAGELVSIVGISGSGKSSLLSLVSGLIKPTKGSIYINDNIIKNITNKTGYMLQKDNLLNWRTIEKNVMLGLEITKKNKKENIEFSKKLLKTYGLWEFRNKYPNQISGGMRQRTALIRTLSIKPEILLLDEAFSALDYQTRLLVANDVFNILKKENKTAIIVTHDITEALSMSDKIIILSKRPGTVKLEMELEFKNIPPLKRREEDLFHKYFNKIWKELDI